MFLVLIRFRKLQRLRFLQLFYTNFREQVKNSFEYPNIGILSNVIFRSSRPEVFCQKGILRNFAKFTGKHLWQSLLFNKVASLYPLKMSENLWFSDVFRGYRPVTLLKKRLWHRCFPVYFARFLRTLFIIEHPWWLLLVFATFAR